MPISLAPQIPAFRTRTPFWDKQEARSTSWWFLIMGRIYLCYLLPSYILSLFQRSVVICLFISRHLQLILLWGGQIKLICQRGSDSVMSDERRCLYVKVNPTFERLTAVCSNYICNCSVLMPVIWSNQDYTFLFELLFPRWGVKCVNIIIIILFFFFLLLASLLLCTFCSSLVVCIHNFMSLQYSGLGHPSPYMVRKCVSDAKFSHFIPKEESEKVHKSVCLIFIIFVLIVIAFNIATTAIIVIILHNEN